MEVEYCYDHGIPHSQFLGRVPQFGEPLWTDEDRNKFREFLRYKADTCPTCGSKNSDWVDEDGRWLDNPEFEAATYTCYGCHELERLRKSMPTDLMGVFTILKRYVPGEVQEVVRREWEAEQRRRDELLEEHYGTSDPEELNRLYPNR